MSEISVATQGCSVDTRKIVARKRPYVKMNAQDALTERTEHVLLN